MYWNLLKDEFVLMAISLIGGFLLDMIFGDPYRLPHPVRIIGSFIAWFDKHLNRGAYITLKGCFTVISIVGFTFGVLYVIVYWLKNFPWWFVVFGVIMLFYGIANKQLIKEGIKVERTLKQQNLFLARKQLSMIVGRDTSQLNEHQIRKAVLETLAENLSDGVIAPLFYYALGGIPLMFAYKAINTLDSMIGYKNPRYKDFGLFAAKLDDVVNFLPARITALLMVVAGWSKRGLRYIFLYGHRHSSPNAGYPEAALAGILNCRFGGPNIYHGEKINKPYIGEHERTLTHKDVKRTAYINHLTTIIFVLLIISLSLIFTLT